VSSILTVRANNIVSRIVTSLLMLKIHYSQRSCYILGYSSEAEQEPVKFKVEISKFSIPAGLGFTLLNLQDKEKVKLGRRPG